MTKRIIKDKCWCDSMWERERGDCDSEYSDNNHANAHMPQSELQGGHMSCVTIMSTAALLFSTSLWCYRKKHSHSRHHSNLKVSIYPMFGNLNIFKTVY